jgi:kynurenine 3-monooxygenase
MPFEKFEVLTTREELLSFFHSTFPDSVGLMGEEQLVQSFFKNPRGSLMSIKVLLEFY